MKRLPYCLVANRILSSILPQTGRADDTKTYHQRVIAMDPYFASAPDNVLSADSVAESAINIERLAYRPGQAAGGPAQPAWAASLGIAFEENQADRLPDWLQDQSGLETASKPATQSVPAEPFSWETNAEEAASLEETLSSEDAIPDWMKEVGWQPATGAAVEQPTLPELEFPVELPEGEIAKAEIPDWLRGLAPSEAMDEEPTSEPIVSGELDLPWLQKTTPGASDTIVNWLGTQKQTAQTPGEPEKSTRPGAGVPGEEGGLPDWLQGVESSYGRSGITDWLKTSHVEDYEAKIEPAPEPPVQNEPVGEEPAIPSEELPEWLKEMGAPAAELASEEQAAEEPALPADGLPDWLKEMGEPLEEIAPVEPVTEEPALPADQLPEWLKEMSGPSVELAPIEPVTEEPTLPAEELPEWLKEMGGPAVEHAPVEPVVEDPALSTEELPEWLIEIGEPAAELAPEELVAEKPALPAEELHMGIGQIIQPAEEIASVESGGEEDVSPFEDIPYWLKETAKITPAELSTLPVDLSAEESTLPEIMLPDWLLEIGRNVPPSVEAAPIESEAKAEAITGEEIPAEYHEPADLTAPVIEPAEDSGKESAVPAEDLPEWLKEMGEPAGELPSPFREQSDQDAALAWLEALAAKQGVQEEELITKPEDRQEKMPDWIRLEAEESQPEGLIPVPPTAHEEPAHPAEELPNWLREIAEPAPEAAPVEPASILPTPFMDQNDQDTALAWLEKLAAQHGAREEEFITKPEERRETIPDWVKLGAEEALQEEQLPTLPAESEAPALSPDELPEWLKDIGEPAVVLPSEQIIAVEASLPAQEAAVPAEELPEWLLEMAAPAEALAPEQPIALEASLQVQEAAVLAEELPEWFKEMAAPAAEIAPVEQAGEIPAASIDLTDQDAALAWLEGLAAQHGAREEEMITRPEDRLETMPDWIKQEAESSLATEETPTQPVPLEVIVPAIPEVEEPVVQVEQLLEAPTELEEPVSEPAPGEELVLPEVELPDWLAETAASLEAIDLGEEQADTEQLPDWLLESVPPTQVLPGEESTGEMQKLPDWLKEVDQFATDEAGAFPSAELPAAPAWMPEAILPETELPTPPAYVPTEQSAPEDVSAQIPETEPLRREPLVLDINTASMAQFEHLPGIGFVAAQNILAYREANGPFSTIDDLVQVDGVEPALIDDLRTLLTTGIPEPEVTAEPVVETEAILFTNARHALAEGEVSQASDLYNRLVAQGADLEKVIVDMQDALYRHPLDINFWQILGDAYLRTDKLQEALDAYTEAEELLR